MSRRYAGSSYPLLLAAFGCICLTVTGGWQVYTEPLKNGGAKILQVLTAGGQEDFTQIGGLLADGEEAGGTDGLPGDPNVKGPEDEEGAVRGPEDGEGSAFGPEEDGEEHPEGPVYHDVEDDYFADAAFIGDSRTVGLYEYGGLEETATFYASTGLTVHKLFTEKIVAVPGQKKKITVEEDLSQRQFAKVYLMIGINEMGTGTVESFLEKYAECVEHIRELQPEAVICLQSILRVTEERSEQGDYITNEGIDARNEGIAAMADNEHVFYLDVNEVVCDETGALTADYTHDGVHLKAQYIALWKEYLKSHAVTPE